MHDAVPAGMAHDVADRLTPAHRRARRTNGKEFVMETLRPPKKRSAVGSQAARASSEIPGSEARFERISRWAFWIILFVGATVAYWLR